MCLICSSFNRPDKATRVSKKPDLPYSGITSPKQIGYWWF